MATNLGVRVEIGESRITRELISSGRKWAVAAVMMEPIE